MGEYYIDIDPNSPAFSKSFKDFYHHHFVNSIGLGRGEIDTSFFLNMTDEEKEIAKRLIRMNLKLRHSHLFKAAGELKDVEALPILYDILKMNTDLSWLLSIGQAIWKINGDDLYPKLLAELKGHKEESMKVAHFEQITDLKNESSINDLFDYLNDKHSFVRSLAHSRLEYILMGTYPLYEHQYDREFFLSKKNDKEFKKQLLSNLRLMED